MKANLTRGNSITENYNPYSTPEDAIACALAIVQDTIQRLRKNPIPRREFEVEFEPAAVCINPRHGEMFKKGLSGVVSAHSWLDRGTEAISHKDAIVLIDEAERSNRASVDDLKEISRNLFGKSGCTAPKPSGLCR